MRTIKLSLSLRIAAFVLATLGATGALVAAGLNESSTPDLASGAASPAK
jgi:hypothetical protein